MATTFEMDPNFEDELLHGPGVREILVDRTAAVAQRASRLAPDDPSTTGKDLHTNIEPEVAMTGRGWHGRVNAFDWKAGFYEFGTSRQSARPFLRPALEAEVGPIEQGPDE